jgi:hypothetical protein
VAISVLSSTKIMATGPLASASGALFRNESSDEYSMCRTRVPAAGIFDQNRLIARALQALAFPRKEGR